MPTIPKTEAKRVLEALEDAQSFFEMFDENPSDARRGKRMGRAAAIMRRVLVGE